MRKRSGQKNDGIQNSMELLWHSQGPKVELLWEGTFSPRCEVQYPVAGKESFVYYLWLRGL